MQMQSWQVASLPRVECYLPRHAEVHLPLRHAGTTVRGTTDGDGRLIGDTVWYDVLDGQLVAVSWDWIEVVPQAVCLLDPNNIVTNLQFMDPHGCYEEPMSAIVSVNRVVHQLPWQLAVLKCLANGSLPDLHVSAVLDRRSGTSDLHRQAA